MEPISLAASLLTLVSSTTEAIKFFRAVRNTPPELQKLHLQVRQLRSALDLQHQLKSSHLHADALAKPPCLNWEETVHFESALGDASRCLESIEKSLAKHHDKPSKIMCGRWVLRHRTDILQLVQNMHHIEQTVMSLLITMSTSVALASNYQLRDIGMQQKQTLEQLKQMMSSNTTLVNCTPSQLIPQWFNHPSRLDPPQIPVTQRQRSLVKMYRIRPGCKTIQKKSSNTNTIVFQTKWDELRTVYRVSGTVRLPSILSAYALKVQLQATFSALHLPSLSQLVSLRNIVSNDSQFMKACDAGDYESARNLALSGKGSPTDIDEHGQPALHRAIRGGSYELVKFLLENGASASEPEGVMFESPLQTACKFGLIDIGRLLMLKGTCVQHIDIGGFTAVISLWCQRSLSFSRADFLKVMLAYSPLPIRPDDDEFWNPAFQVARQGCTSDMELLVHLGANIYALDMFGNNIMKYCIGGSNVETFDYLIGHIPPEWIHKQDSHGRTALHHVFDHPCPSADAIAERLIRIGADIHAKDNEGRSVADIARNTDYLHKDRRVWKTGTCGNFDAWLKTLRSLEYDVEVDDEGDLIWPAAQET